VELHCALAKHGKGQTLQQKCVQYVNQYHVSIIYGTTDEHVVVTKGTSELCVSIIYLTVLTVSYKKISFVCAFVIFVIVIIFKLQIVAVGVFCKDFIV